MRLAHLKLLLAVMLLAWTCVTCVQSTRHEADHGQDISNALALAPNGVATTRKLRYDATLTTRDQTNETEERTPSENFLSRVTEAVAMQFPGFDYEIRQIALKALSMAGSSPADMFTFLGLDKAGENLFRNPRFFVWHNTIRGYDPKLSDQKIFPVLRQYYNDRELAIALIQGRMVPLTESAALHFQKLQRRSWKNFDISSDVVFDLLELHKVGQDFIKDPLVFTWVAYVKDNEKDAVSVIAEKLVATPKFNVAGKEQAVKDANLLLEYSTKYFEKVNGRKH